MVTNGFNVDQGFQWLIGHQLRVCEEAMSNSTRKTTVQKNKSQRFYPWRNGYKPFEEIRKSPSLDLGFPTLVAA
ncbi:hypothetical protein QQP08_016377 [Theobroma cacao]|nr:hypothetical protein QQP08_016377 [Theobroma cacao]